MDKERDSIESYFTVMKYIQRALLSILLLLGLTTHANAQRLISGYVTDQSTGESLIGATVSALKSGESYPQIGTQTNSQGFFELMIPDDIQQIEVRFVGYLQQRIRLSNTASTLRIELQPGTLVLDGVTVSAFEGRRSLLETAGAVAVLSQPTIERSQNVSLAPALNTVAGVRMEESGYGGSSRVSIRGSLLRSPFGIRNIKVYWNDIPLTDPSGSTSRFNSIDASDLGRLEIIKGPAGSLYGAGTGGVLLMQSSRPPAQSRSVSFEQTMGAFDLRRSIIRANVSEGQARVRLSLIDQDSRGYRDHQRVWKQSLQFTAGLTPSDKRDVALHVFHYNGTYQLPGPLTLAQVAETPTMAIPFSKSIDARVSLRNTGIALSQRLLISKKWQNTSSLGIIVQDKENPSGTSPAFNQHEISTFQGITGRSVFNYAGDAHNPTSVQFGVEAQTGFSLEKYYAANAGQPGLLRSDAEIEASSITGFVQIEKNVSERLLTTAGLSINATRYDVVDRLGSDGLGGRDELIFGPTIAPRLALVYTMLPGMAAHVSASYGFSTPTQWEVKTLAGVNADLRPEQGLNTELGWRWQTKDGRYAIDMSGYTFRLKQALLPQFTESGLPFFANAGSTIQNGIELSATALVFRLNNGIDMSLSGSGAWNNYQFDDYRSNATVSGVVQERDYSGNKMTGTAPWSGSLSTDLNTPFGITFHIGARYMDAIPINDANTVYSRSYLLINSRIDIDQTVATYWGLGLRIGVDNLTNRYWENLLALNGAGARYFNPGAPRNAYARLRITRQL